MKILHIEMTDTDDCGDFLTKTAETRFLDGKFTHVESEGSICETEITDVGVLIGVEVSYIEDFDGYYVHYDKVVSAVNANSAGECPRCYCDDPLELIGELVNEHESLLELVKFIKSSLVKINYVGHTNSYDWNEDKCELTALEGEMFERINRLLAEIGTAPEDN